MVRASSNEREYTALREISSVVRSDITAVHI
jgi:hypothetical protein